MRKKVLISIIGFHYAVTGGEETNEPIEVITPASYYQKNGKHYVVYDEVVEGTPGTVRNLVRLEGDTLLELSKSGAVSSRMVFEKGKIHMTSYQTPFGEILVGIHTKNMDVDIQEDRLHVALTYALDVNQQELSNCYLTMDVRSVGEEKA